MKTRHRALLGAVALQAVLGFAQPVLADSHLNTVYVNGTKVAARPLVRDGVAYLPANTLAEALGVTVRWDATLNIVKVNNQMVNATPMHEEGRVYLPVEAIANSVGGAVEWDGQAHAIRITSGASAAGSKSGESASLVVPLPASSPSTPAVRPTPSPSTRPVAQGDRVAPSPSTPRTAVVSVGGSFTPVPTSVGLQGSSTPSATAVAVSTPSYTPTIQVPRATTQDAQTRATRPTTSEPSVPTPAYGGASVYVPKSAQNGVFAVTVTNIETAGAIKDFYHPRPGYRFVIVYLSQQNVSNEVQIYTGRFSLLDQNNQAHDYVEGLSNFWLVILRPYGINFGYLVFEMPVESNPTRLALHALNQAPLTLNL